LQIKFEKFTIVATCQWPLWQVWSRWVAWFKSLFGTHRHIHRHTDMSSIMYKI